MTIFCLRFLFSGFQTQNEMFQWSRQKSFSYKSPQKSIMPSSLFHPLLKLYSVVALNQVVFREPITLSRVYRENRNEHHIILLLSDSLSIRRNTCET